MDGREIEKVKAAQSRVLKKKRKSLMVCGVTEKKNKT